MTTPFWCLLIALVIPILLAFLCGYYKTRQFGRIDNRHPRVQGDRLEGAGARAWAAQQNAWEALAMFTAAVVVAHLAGADPGSSAVAALVFIAARLVHAGAYLADLHVVRSVSFLVALGSCLWLFALAARA